MTQGFDREGLIKAATVSAADASALVQTYTHHLGLKVIEKSTVSEGLASSWGAPDMAGQASYLMASDSGTPIYIRIVENPDMPPYTPLRSYGWNAMEICVEDVDGLYARLKNSPFTIIGPPKELEIASIIYPMQAVGPEGEVLFLNEVRGSLPDHDLPKAQVPVDHIFIMILATPDREKALDFYTHKLGWDRGDSYNLTYTVINKAFGFGPDHKTDITTTCVGRLVNNEIDQYPPGTMVRDCADGMLPPGIAAVSYMVNSLDTPDVDFIGAPQVQDGTLYGGRRSACCIGTAGELIELIEIG